MIRIATIGTSPISECLIEVLRASPRAAYVGTMSRDAGRAATFTRAHGGTRAFASLDELAASTGVDAVYIGTPNALHRDQALACIARGKHVLVEKAFCANHREAAEVFDAAEAAGVVALEAMRPVHDPAFWAVADALPQLGRLRRATLRFGKYSSRYDEVLAGRRTNIFDCAMASGALMDIGVYTVEPMVALFGMPASTACAAALLDDSTRALTNGPIDGAGVIMASYPGMVATAHYSKVTNDLSSSQFEGELGTLTVDGISVPRRARVDLRVAPGADAAGYSGIETAPRELDLPHADDTMAYELDDFIGAVEAVRGGADAAQAPAGPYGDVARHRDLTLGTMALLDEARRQAGIAFPADEPPA